MSTTSSFIREWAQARETSDEVARAIFELTTGQDAQRLWESPSVEEEKRVMRRAWEIAAPDEGALFWGTEVYTRARMGT